MSALAEQHRAEQRITEKECQGFAVNDYPTSQAFESRHIGRSNHSSFC